MNDSPNSGGEFSQIACNPNLLRSRWRFVGRDRKQCIAYGARTGPRQVWTTPRTKLSFLGFGAMIGCINYGEVLGPSGGSTVCNGSVIFVWIALRITSQQQKCLPTAPRVRFDQLGCNNAVHLHQPGGSGCISRPSAAVNVLVGASLIQPRPETDYRARDAGVQAAVRFYR